VRGPEPEEEVDRLLQPAVRDPLAAELLGDPQVAGIERRERALDGAPGRGVVQPPLARPGPRDRLAPALDRGVARRTRGGSARARSGLAGVAHPDAPSGEASRRSIASRHFSSVGTNAQRT